MHIIRNHSQKVYGIKRFFTKKFFTVVFLSDYLNYEMGIGNTKKLQETFSSALIIHFIIALIIVVLAETVGLWYLYNRLVIPEGRFNAAMWVYQCAVISSALTITQVPYNAFIIARDRKSTRLNSSHLA